MGPAGGGLGLVLPARQPPARTAAGDGVAAGGYPRIRPTALGPPAAATAGCKGGGPLPDPGAVAGGPATTVRPNGPVRGRAQGAAAHLGLGLALPGPRGRPDHPGGRE